MQTCDLPIKIKLDDEVNAFLAETYGSISDAFEKLTAEWEQRINASIREDMERPAAQILMQAVPETKRTLRAIDAATPEELAGLQREINEARRAWGNPGHWDWMVWAIQAREAQESDA